MTESLSAGAARALRESPVVWLTTLRADGSPHTTPVWFLFDGDHIWMATGKRNRKVANLMADDRVSIAVDGSGSRPVVAQARAAIVALADVPPAVVAGLARKYDGWDIRDDAVDGERVVLKMTIDRWLFGG